MFYRGFSLLELIVCMAILLISLSHGFPSLLNSRNTSLIESETQNLQKNLLLARSYALNHSAKVTICPLNQQSKCHNNWQDGYSIFIDSNYIGNKEADDKIILTYQAPHKLKLSFNGGNKLTYNANGSLSSLSGTFIYCFKEVNIKLAKAVIVNMNGRARSSADYDGNGIDEKSPSELSTELHCP